MVVCIHQDTEHLSFRNLELAADGIEQRINPSLVDDLKRGHRITALAQVSHNVLIIDSFHQ